MGITKLDGVTLEELKRPRRQIPAAKTIEEADVAASVSETGNGSQPPASS